MSTKTELLALFQGLYVEARTLAEEVFGSKAKRSNHPCAYLVEDCYYDPKGKIIVPPQWPATWRHHWHLPEPFIGDVLGSPQVVFVGLNPSIDSRECCPGYGTSVDEWLRFWREGFGAKGKLRVEINPVGLYGHYQRVLVAALGGNATLGKEALVTEIIRYKAACPTGRRRGQRALLDAVKHQSSLPLTLKLLEKIGVPVIVTVGGLSTQQMGGHFAPKLKKAKVTEVHGRVYKIRNGACVIPALHRNHHGSPRADDLAEGIAKALAGKYDVLV